MSLHKGENGFLPTTELDDRLLKYFPGRAENLDCNTEEDRRNQEGGVQELSVPEEEEEVVLTSQLVEDILGPEEHTQCGLGTVRGGTLQKLATPVTYLVISSVVALVQGIFYTYANATLSTVEKRFRLPSKISGLVTTGNDVIQLVLALHISFLAGRGHRPRWLALSMLCAALGCLLAAIPHFIFGAGDLVSLQQDNTNSTHPPSKELCGFSDNSTSSCETDMAAIGAEQYTVVTLQLLSQMLAGFASLMYYTIGYTYLDEAVSKKRVPIFLAVSGSMRILGPVCGYSLASWALSHWVTPSLTPDLHPRHPRWVGAWWIGYLVIGSSLLVITWSLVLMPRTLPGARRRALVELKTAAEKGKEALQAFAETLRPAQSKGYKGMCGSLRRLLTNKVFILITFNQVFFWFAFFGYITFKPKFLEHQFKMSAAKANQYIAGAALAATLVGWLATGVAITLFRPRTKTVLAFMAILSLTDCLLHLCMVNISCDHDIIRGMDQVLESRVKAHPEHQVSVPKNNITLHTSLDDCSSECGCNFKFSPVCVDGVTNFYSACFAGCTAVAKANGTIVYKNCTCSNTVESVSVISSSVTSYVGTASPDVTSEGTSASPVSSAVAGYCRYDCPTFYMYLALTVLTKMTNAASRVPVNIILFRCVQERDKDLALGVFNAVLALGASIPAPIIFGWVIDQACRLWEQTCGRRGFCWLYNLDVYRHILHGIPAGLMAGCLLTELILLSMHKSIHLYGEEDEPSTHTVYTTTTEEERKNKQEIDACL
ncbi:solute carrier organic anion transporter family member 1C1-like isoform X2 [Homarus americanus]|uniref:solute carrier organic anion transporter family member 1C1-like isoform X2 n=1 Tax=Homarus americanus TaxID=6706 RepID=UPI001C46C0BF|nr:solute carrier organic anion transporter family member 1C1-like isoform X2 [Homarus americanus]